MIPAAAFARALAGPAPPPEADAEATVAAALDHGIAGGLAASGALEGWPEAVRAPLLAQARNQALWELRHKALLMPLLRSMTIAGVRHTLMKGTALAYGVYPTPAIRARGDSDLLVAAEDLTTARTVLRTAGFSCPVDDDAPPGARRQEPWALTAPDGTRHGIDLHWRLSNNPAFAAVLGDAEALEEAVPLPALGLAARALAPASAVILATLHRAGHAVAPYFVEDRIVDGEDRLVWLWDIDLQLRAMTAGEIETLAARSVARGIGPLMAQTLERTRALFGTPLPDDLLARLSAGPEGPAMRFLARRTRLGRVLGNLASVPPRAMLPLLKSKALPPTAMLRRQMPELAHLPGPWLHIVRLSRFLSGRR